MASADTTVRVSRATLSELVRFQHAIRVETLDDAIRSLLILKRKELVAQVYGRARGIRPLREADRLDADR